jgi:hypothetical protein
MRKVPLLAGLAVVLLAAGCSSSDGKLEVSGTVMFKGAPLDQGTIQFFVKERPELVASAQIKDGKYTVPARAGLQPGTYRIVISSGEPGTRAEESMPGQAGPPAKERIPPEYNVRSMEKPVLREVKKGEKLDFDIK